MTRIAPSVAKTFQTCALAYAVVQFVSEGAAAPPGALKSKYEYISLSNESSFCFLTAALSRKNDGKTRI
jgi:hypothetical protein